MKQDLQIIEPPPGYEEVPLGRRLRTWRLEQNFSQDTAARMLGVAVSTWSHWETGRRLPTPRLLLMIRELTGMPLGYLLCENAGTCPRQPYRQRLP